MSAALLFSEPEAARPPVGEYTHIKKPADAPFLPELAARMVGGLGPEWKWHRATSLHADESDPFHSPRIGVRVHLNVPTTTRTGKQKWPPVKTDRVLIVTEAQEQEAAAQWEREHGACVRCGGDGLTFAGCSSTLGTKYAVCTKCSGTGKPEVHP